MRGGGHNSGGKRFPLSEIRAIKSNLEREDLKRERERSPVKRGVLARLSSTKTNKRGNLSEK